MKFLENAKIIDQPYTFQNFNPSSNFISNLLAQVIYPAPQPSSVTNLQDILNVKLSTPFSPNNLPLLSNTEEESHNISQQFFITIIPDFIILHAYFIYAMNLIFIYLFFFFFMNCKAKSHL